MASSKTMILFNPKALVFTPTRQTETPPKTPSKTPSKNFAFNLPKSVEVCFPSSNSACYSIYAFQNKAIPNIR